MSAIAKMSSSFYKTEFILKNKTQIDNNEKLRLLMYLSNKNGSDENIKYLRIQHLFNKGENAAAVPTLKDTYDISYERGSKVVFLG